MARTFANLAEVRKFLAQAVDPVEQAGLKIAREIQHSGELLALSNATDARNVEVGALHAKLVRQQIKKAESGLAMFELALARLRDVIGADGIDLEPEAKSLERRMNRIEEPRDMLARVIAQANDFLDDYEKMAKQVATSDTAVLAAWSRTMTAIRDVEPSLESLIERARKLTLEAQRAAQARDLAALSKARDTAKAGRAMLEKKPPAGLIKQHIVDFQKTNDPKKMSPTVRTQFSADVREATALAAKLGKRYETCLQQFDFVFSHEIAPPDADRAIKVLGLKSNVLADMKKALKMADDGSDSAAIKAMDAIAKQAGLKLAGKDMLTKLRREKVL